VADLSKEQADKTLAALKAAANPTPRMLALVSEIQKKTGEAYEIALRAGLIGQDPVQKTGGHRGTEGARLEQVAEDVAGVIAETFGSGQFTSLFNEQTLADRWTLGEAMAVWYSLGNLVLFVAASTAYQDQARVIQLYDRCKPLLLRRWQMSDKSYERFRSVIETRGSEDIQSFKGCNSGNDLFLFFGRYVNRILGRPEILETGKGTFVNSCDPIICMVICKMFVDICSDMKNFLSAAH
jgi:hypothetical protein